MKKKSTSQSAPARRSFSEGGFFNLRVLIASVFCLIGVFVALLGSGAFSNLFAQTKGIKQAGVAARQDATGAQTPNVVRLIGPVVMNTNLRNLPYVAPHAEIDRPRLTRYPFPLSGRAGEIGNLFLPARPVAIEANPSRDPKHAAATAHI